MVSVMYENDYYETYRTGGTDFNTINTEPVREPYKEPKKKSGVLGKILLSISLGLFFGLFAGIGFYGVTALQGTGAFGEPKTEAQSTFSGTADVAQEGMTSTGDIQFANTNSITVVESDISAMVEEVMPAMVSIVNNYTYQYRDFFGQTYTQTEPASGSGIIVGETEEELLIVSNHHVVADADELIVTFIDNTTAQAQIKGLDEEMDLAVIAISLKDLSQETKQALSIAALGNSDTLKLGEPVVAIGNALGYGQSVTNGIVSALDRELTMDDGSTATYIQTNAAINGGNSGGALLNVKGEVIGINSAKIGGSMVEGMGYAIPISSASPIIADLMERQTRNKVEEGNMGYLGISLQEVTSQISKMYNMPEGIYVIDAEVGGAAYNAGIMTGDIITKFDGQRVESYDELQSILQYYAVGTTTEITICRPENGAYVEHELQVTLGQRPTDLGEY